MNGGANAIRLQISSEVPIALIGPLRPSAEVQDMLQGHWLFALVLGQHQC